MKERERKCVVAIVTDPGIWHGFCPLSSSPPLSRSLSLWGSSHCHIKCVSMYVCVWVFVGLCDCVILQICSSLWASSYDAALCSVHVRRMCPYVYACLYCMFSICLIGACAQFLSDPSDWLPESEERGSVASQGQQRMTKSGHGGKIEVMDECYYGCDAMETRKTMRVFLMSNGRFGL